MTNTLSDEALELARIIGSPITYMEHVSKGKHSRARHLVYVADRVMEKLRQGKPMAEKLEEVGEQQFLACFIPVRHAKSTFLGLYLSTWLMGVFPGIKILFVTYSDDRALKWGGDARDVMKVWGPTLFGTSVRKDRESGNYWACTNGSEMRAVGIGGAIVGEGFHVVIIDDTLKNPEEADSPTTKRKQVEWYYETLRNRLEPGGMMLFAMARWREDDLPGQVCIEASDDDVGTVDEWEVIRFPALAEAPLPEVEVNPYAIEPPPEGWAEGVEAWVAKWRQDFIDDATEKAKADWRDELGREDGEPLWPQKWPRKLLERIKTSLLKRGQSGAWDALYQQNPTPKEGGSFKVDRWRRIGMAPPLRLEVRAWDLSASLRKGDYTCGVKMGLGFNNEVYILHVVRERLDPAGVQNLVVTTAEQDGPACFIRMEEEKGASGKSNSATFAQKLMGFMFSAEPVSGTKEVRAAGYAAHQGNSLCILVDDGTWDTAAFVEEHRAFPGGRHDDQVDAAALGFRFLSLGGMGPGEMEVIMSEDDETPVARAARRRAEAMAG